jgi:hypothetical protein
MKLSSICSTAILSIATALMGACSADATAQMTFSVEEYMVHDADTGIPELEGMTTYRIYVNLEHELDFVSALYGGSESPFVINVDDPMFNSPFATGATSGGVIAMLTSYFPEVGFDSWLTIGLESAPASLGQMDVSILESDDQPFVESFVAGSDRDGLSFEISDEMGGAWFVLNGTANGYAGDDLRVLVMQITCSSVPSGILNAQVIPANGTTDSEQLQQGFNGTEVWDLSPPAAVGGCTDPAACNYDENATEDDGSCVYEDCQGCTDSYACNYDAQADSDDGTCEYATCLGCTDLSACNYDSEALYNDGTCDYTSCLNNGCTNSSACNYDADAETDDGSCDFISCAGCTDESADNYDASATQDNGSCEYLGCTNPLACNFVPSANISDDSCDFTSCVGCMDMVACNYSPDYTISSPTTCIFADEFYDCNGDCLNDSDEDGTCDELEILGCTNSEANNFDSNATEDDGSCELPVTGCTNPFACNYNPAATQSDDSCDFVSCTGCTNEGACNYDPDATVSNNGDCVYPELGLDCDGACLTDDDFDGICNEFEIFGCTDELALNFFSIATENDGSCTYPAVCNDAEACNYTPYEGYCISIEPHVVHDGVVGESDLSGFTTYRIYALCENESDFVSAVAGDEDFATNIYSSTSFFQHPTGSALAEGSNPFVFPFIPDAEFDSWVTIGLDGPVAGGTSESGVSLLEGNTPWVQPFEAGGSLTMNDDLGGVWYVLNGASNGVAGDDLKVLLGQFTTDGNLGGQMYVQFFEEGDGVNGAFNKMIYLQDACVSPSIESCVFPEQFLDCEGACLSDSDGDGTCDELEVAGCTDSMANNYDEGATDDDGSCDYTVDPCSPDLTAPYFTFIPADSTVLCSQPMPTLMAEAMDECDDEVQVVFVDGPIEFIFDCPPFNYLCTRTFYATDAAGNVSEAQQMITVADTLAPEFLNLPAETVFINQLEGEQIPDPFITVQDACDGNAEWTSIDQLISSDQTTAIYQRTYSASDACGNVSNWEQIIEVILMLPGCTDALACNYDELVNTDDGSCVYPEDYVDCAGVCLSDSDSDGICDELEVLGCTIGNACNFSEEATDDDGSCEFCSCADDDLPVFGLEIDTIQVHAGGVLDGMVTYRLYATTETADDFISAVYGNDLDTLSLQTTTSWYQNEMGALLAQNIAPEMVATFPELAFDSWLTIGLDGPVSPGENLVNTVGAVGDASWTAAFEAGESVTLDDAVGGAWFALNGGSNGVAGDDLKVLIAQLTTDGDISGQLNVQMFEDGANNQSSTHHFTFEGGNWTNPVSYANACGCMDDDALNFDPDADYDDGSCVLPVLGCTDALACNFDALADLDDDSCEFPEAELDCEGNCLEDIDGDGVCDAFEVSGCTDDQACNYSMDATDDDDSCIYPEFALDCDGNCLNDTDADGVCDENELFGCTDLNALNFDDAATEEDGSCAYCSLEAAAVVFDVSCNGGLDGSFSFSATGAYPLGSDIQFMLLPDGEFSGDSVFSGLAAGIYEGIAMDVSGCMDTISIEVGEPEALQVLLNEVVGSEEGQAEGSIDVDVSGGTGDYTFEWTMAEDVNFTSNEQNLSGLVPGTYELLVEDSNGCTVVSFPITVEGFVGVQEFEILKLMAYPNPAVDWVQFEWDASMKLSQLFVHDGQGKLVHEQQLLPFGNSLRMDLSDWSSGVYFVQVVGDHHEQRIQLIKRD